MDKPFVIAQYESDEGEIAYMPITKAEADELVRDTLLIPARVSISTQALAYLFNEIWLQSKGAQTGIPVLINFAHAYLSDGSSHRFHPYNADEILCRRELYPDHAPEGFQQFISRWVGDAKDGEEIIVPDSSPEEDPQGMD